MSKLCKAKNPSTCRHHGAPLLRGDLQVEYTRFDNLLKGSYTVLKGSSEFEALEFEAAESYAQLAKLEKISLTNWSKNLFEKVKHPGMAVFDKNAALDFLHDNEEGMHPRVIALAERSVKFIFDVDKDDLYMGECVFTFDITEAVRNAQKAKKPHGKPSVV